MSRRRARAVTTADSSQFDGFAQVIVSTDEEPAHLVARPATRGDDHDAQALALAAESVDQVDAVTVWQAQVHQCNQVVGGREGRVECGGRADGVHNMTLLGQVAGEFLAQDGFVFEQDQMGHDIQYRRRPRRETEEI